MANKIIRCRLCGNEMPESVKVCAHCGAKNKQPLYKKWWIWVLGAVVAIGVIGGSNDSEPEPQTNTSPKETIGAEAETNSKTVDTKVKYSAFSSDCGISATAEMGTDIIGQPTVTVSITNNTDTDISAIKFYAVPLNVYGEEVKGFLSQNELQTDDTIVAGSTDTRTWQFLDDDVKTVKLYVYSVYFSDGTQWGDKDATKSVILKNALEILVDGKSEN